LNTSKNSSTLAEVPQLPPEVLKDLNIICVKGRGYMRATIGDNGSIIVMSVSQSARIVHHVSGTQYAYDPPSSIRVRLNVSTPCIEGTLGAAYIEELARGETTLRRGL